MTFTASQQKVIDKINASDNWRIRDDVRDCDGFLSLLVETVEQHILLAECVGVHIGKRGKVEVIFANGFGATRDVERQRVIAALAYCDIFGRYPGKGKIRIK